MRDVSAPAFWEGMYAAGEDGWELGGPHPTLVHLLRTAPPPAGRVAVPGCGRGHDARLLARHGYEVTAFDFVPAVLDEARALARREGVAVDFQARDLFALGPEYSGAFDGVWEYTCYCAIDPGRRSEYVDVVARILRPGGWFLAVFFPVRGGEDGPPFPVDLDEVRRLLGGRFRIEHEGRPPRPVPARAGHEWLVRAVRLPD
ncbi:MAG TPA: methyltransferase domain-containing protein [Candidatus Binatia bacterium]|nr:methyltransferase domain-containing protein [Candidatus Binatia bacterium]